MASKKIADFTKKCPVLDEAVQINSAQDEINLNPDEVKKSLNDFDTILRGGKTDTIF